MNKFQQQSTLNEEELSNYKLKKKLGHKFTNQFGTLTGVFLDYSINQNRAWIMPIGSFQSITVELDKFLQTFKQVQG